MSVSQPQGYLALPASGTGAGVLVLHAWWGLNETIRTICKQLAEAGFIAFAPDLYHGKVVDAVADAEAISQALDADRARADVARAAAFVNERAGQANRGIAVIGFSLGVYFAMELSALDPAAIRSVVIFYGTRDGDYSNARANYLGHFAEMDPFEPQSSVDEMEASLRRAGREVKFHRYPDTGHWFFEPDRADAYNATAASLAWEQTLDFLNLPTS
ncbi:dienelactone hydrolase family protein [soil metagenome]